MRKSDASCARKQNFWRQQEEVYMNTWYNQTQRLLTYTMSVELTLKVVVKRQNLVTLGYICKAIIPTLLKFNCRVRHKKLLFLTRQKCLEGDEKMGLK